MLVFIGLFGCKPKSVFDNVNPEIGIFGTDWVNAPSPEDWAPGIKYYRLDNPQVKEILIKSKLDPREIAKLKVLPFVIQLRKALEEKDYDFIEKHLGWRFTEEAKKEIGINKVEKLTSDEQFEKAKQYIHDKLRSRESFCDLHYLIEKKFPYLGLSLSEVRSRELNEKKTFQKYELSYSISFPRGILNQDGSEGLHSLDVELSVYGKSENETFFGIEDFKNHQGWSHIRSLRPPEEQFEYW
ncbi:hypothetical protein LEP1GSC196_0188 [Leptospira meyeri serovar Semaranga str. Veldrot Semarang 173]|nr:hypothetical protein LEP1GSC196_0188 [Leptospira meyeri serovar Semaranga str. Veldrot Semarang 173]